MNTNKINTLLLFLSFVLISCFKSRESEPISFIALQMSELTLESNHLLSPYFIESFDSRILILDKKNGQILNIYNTLNSKWEYVGGLLGNGPGEFSQVVFSNHKEFDDKIEMLDWGRKLIYTFDVDSLIMYADYKPKAILILPEVTGLQRITSLGDNCKYFGYAGLREGIGAIIDYCNEGIGYVDFVNNIPNENHPRTKPLLYFGLMVNDRKTEKIFTYSSLLPFITSYNYGGDVQQNVRIDNLPWPKIEKSGMPTHESPRYFSDITISNEHIFVLFNSLTINDMQKIDDGDAPKNSQILKLDKQLKIVGRYQLDTFISSISYNDQLNKLYALKNIGMHPTILFSELD